MPPITTTIESGSTSAHQRPPKRVRKGVAIGARGSATSTPWTRLRKPIESQKGRIGGSPRSQAAPAPAPAGAEAESPTVPPADCSERGSSLPAAAIVHNNSRQLKVGEGTWTQA